MAEADDVDAGDDNFLRSNAWCGEAASGAPAEGSLQWGARQDLPKPSQALQQAARVPFEWSEAMVDARTAISEQHDSDANNAREWTLPVLYVRGIEPFTFDRPPPGSEADTAVFKAKARTVAEWLQAVGQQKDESVRQTIMASALDDVPKAFWPKVDGSF